ncbi:MAG: cytochrome c [Myxococcales bacterium]|nr:cytochrome c [Myxococcales bacterium]
MKRLAPVLLMQLAVACRSTDAPVPAPATTATPSASAVVPHGAQAALDRLDPRADVPLLPMMAHHQKQNMRDHLLAVQEIVAAAAASDFDAVDKAVGRIGFSEQMGAMCNHMGAGAPGFSAQAVAFHKTADTIGVAAKKKDRDGVLLALGATLATCTGCHAKWKQRVVDEATWTSVSSQPPPQHSAH